MSDQQLVVVLSTEVEGDLLVVGVFGPYETEAEANEHVGILRDPERLRRVGRENPIFTSQHPLKAPSAFKEQVEAMLTGREG
jgi:hypothetical protein